MYCGSSIRNAAGKASALHRSRQRPFTTFSAVPVRTTDTWQNRGSSKPRGAVAIEVVEWRMSALNADHARGISRFFDDFTGDDIVRQDKRRFMARRAPHRRLQRRGGETVTKDAVME